MMEMMDMLIVYISIISTISSESISQPQTKGEWQMKKLTIVFSRAVRCPRLTVMNIHNEWNG